MWLDSDFIGVCSKKTPSTELTTITSYISLFSKIKLLMKDSNKDQKQTDEGCDMSK